MAETIPGTPVVPDDLVDSIDSYMDGEWERNIAAWQAEMDTFPCEGDYDPDFKMLYDENYEAVPGHEEFGTEERPRVIWVDQTPSAHRVKDGQEFDLGNGRTVAVLAGEVALFRWARNPSDPSEKRDEVYAIIGADNKVAQEAINRFDGGIPKPSHDEGDAKQSVISAA